MFDAQFGKEAVQRRRRQRMVGHRDVEIRAREHRLDIIDQRAEERPLQEGALHCREAQRLDRSAEAAAGAEPAGQQQPRLRPGEHPGDRPQRVHPVAVGTQGWTRRDLHAFDDVDRGDEPEVLVELRLAPDELSVAATALIGDRGPDLEQRCGGIDRLGRPPRLRRQRQRAERTLERAHRDRREAIVLADHLALLGQSQQSIDRGRRHRTDECVDASAAAGDAAAAGVKHHVLLAGRGQRRRQRALGPIRSEARSAHAAFLAALGIADQRNLPAAPGVDMPAIERIGKQLAHHLTAVLERLDRIELRRDVERNRFFALVIGLGPLREQQRRQHVVGPRDATDHVQADCVGPKAPAALQHGLEHRQRAFAERIQLTARADVPANGVDQPPVALGRGAAEPRRIVQAPRQHLMMHIAVLADVDRREVKAEGRNASQQPLHREIAGMAPAVGEQAVGDDLDIASELVRVLVAVRAPVVGVAQALGDLPQENPVRHAVVTRGRDRLRTRDQRGVLVDPLRQHRGDADAACTLGQVLGERLAVGEIRVDDHLLLPRQGVAQRLGMHIGVAVHVAPDPAAESQDRRQHKRFGLDPVGLLQRLGDLVIERGHQPVENLGEVEDHVLALVGDRQPLAGVVFRLPGRSQLGAHATPDAAPLVRCQGRIESIEQQPRHALLLAQDRPSRRLVWVRGKHGLDAQPVQQRQHVFQRQPGGLEPVDRVLDTAWLGLGAVAEEVLATSPDAVHLLSDVDGLEPHRKCALEVARDRGGTALHPRRELDTGRRVAVATPDRKGAIVLHQVEQRLPTLFTQHLADQPTEQVDVLAQGRMLRRKLDIVAVHDGSETESAGSRPALPKVNGFQPGIRTRSPLRPTRDVLRPGE